MEYFIEGVCKVTFEQDAGSTKSRIVTTEYTLGVSPNLDRAQYLDKESLPNKAGSQMVTRVFLEGLVANIHMAHQMGFRDSAEHLRFIISELERGFVQVADVTKGEF